MAEPDSNAEKHNFRENFKVWLEALTFVAVVVYAGLTLSLVRDTETQIGLARAANQTARDALNASMNNERAWLSVENVHLTVQSRPSHVAFTVVNTGNSPASQMLVYSNQGIQQLMADGDEPTFLGVIKQPIPMETGPTLAAGKTQAYDFEIFGSRSRADIPPALRSDEIIMSEFARFADVLTGKAVLQIQILVNYTDIFGQSHLTTNCIAYSVTHGAPHPCEGGHQED